MPSVISNYERQLQVHQFILTRQRVTIDDICQAFDISPATARRDLDALGKANRVQRFHGGAVAIQHEGLEPPIHVRTHTEAEAKKSIGAAAAALVKDGESIFLGSGTTVLEIANQIRKRRITVITNSLLVVNALASQTNINLLSLGGVFRHSEFSFIGQIAERALAELHVDKVFMGIHAIHAELGLMNESLPETHTDRSIINIGQQLIIVADHTKCNRTSTTFVAPLSVVHTFITDVDAPPEFLTTLRQHHNINVVIAPMLDA